MEEINEHVSTAEVDLISTKEFSIRCGCSYEAIRQKIGSEIDLAQTKPRRIDAVKYAYIIRTFENKRK